MKKRSHLIFSALSALCLSLALICVLHVSVRDLTLTGIARSDFQLLTKPVTSLQTSAKPTVQETPPPPSDKNEKKVYILEKDLSDESAKLINMSTVNLSPEILEKRIEHTPTKEKPLVLIVHTHTDEYYVNRLSLENDESCPEGAVAISDEKNESIDCVIDAGKAFANALRTNGVNVIHCTLPSGERTDAWEENKKTVAAYLAAYPSIEFVLDIHSDFRRDGNGNIISPVTQDGKSAQFSILVGSDSENKEHIFYEENLALAMGYKERLDEQEKGLALPVILVNQSLNQELCKGFLTINIGSEGSDPEKIESGANRAAKVFADMILGQ